MARIADLVDNAPTDSLDLTNPNGTNFARTVKEYLEFIFGDIWGTAAVVDVGTEDEQIPRNSDLGDASLENVYDGQDPEGLVRYSQLPTGLTVLEEGNAPSEGNIPQLVANSDGSVTLPERIFPTSVRTGVVYNEIIRANESDEITATTIAMAQTSAGTVALDTNKDLDNFEYISIFFLVDNNRPITKQIFRPTIPTSSANAIYIDLHDDEIRLFRNNTGTEIYIWKTSNSEMAKVTAIVGHR